MISTHSNTVLVTRFSALGDVAMTIPVIKELLDQNPTINILYVSRERFSPLFENIDRLKFFPADLENEYKGISGLYRLYRKLNTYKIDTYADLHNVLRTKILRSFFNYQPMSISILNKGREERKALVRQKNKNRKPIKPMVERYGDVFRQLGFNLNLSHKIKETATKENTIGIAPFAMYEGKMYPFEKMKIVAKEIAESGTNVYLFGSREEAKELESWEILDSNIKSIAGKYNFKEELELISKLKLMISMDSANMHLASLVGTRVISIWGNTHPYMGFLGYGQSMEDVIQDETLLERPTSVFGKEDKKERSLNYFKKISPEIIIDKIKTAL